MKLHPLLVRQLRTLDIESSAGADSAPHAWRTLLERVSEAYAAAEESRAQTHRLEAIGRLSAGLAHELNTPVQFIGDNLSFLKSSLVELLDLHESTCALVDPSRAAELTAREDAADLAFLRAELPRAIEDALTGTAKLGGIVSAMRSFAHVEQSERPRRVDLNAAIHEVIAVARNETKYVADVVLALGEVEPILAVESDLTQVLLSLIVNAAHAVADATARTGKRGTITVRTVCDDDRVVVEVSDTGAGIPRAVGDRVFDPFFTTKDAKRGTGLGLSVARSLVEKHGGGITFESEEGRGTTFYVRLPRMSSQVAPSCGLPA